MACVIKNKNKMGKSKQLQIQTLLEWIAWMKRQGKMKSKPKRNITKD